MKILEGPEYLMTTLMRFHYDRKQNRKTKVFTDINYELELSLPVFCDNQGKDLGLFHFALKMANSKNKNLVKYAQFLSALHEEELQI